LTPAEQQKLVDWHEANPDAFQDERGTKEVDDLDSLFDSTLADMRKAKAPAPTATTAAPMSIEEIAKGLSDLFPAGAEEPLMGLRDVRANARVRLDIAKSDIKGYVQSLLGIGPARVE